jgi:hypothetical protein
MAKTKPAATNSRQIGFDDPTVKAGGYKERPEVYKAKSGILDRVRIMTPAIRFYGARVADPANDEKGFFAPSLADPADSKLAAEGDEDAIQRCKKVCPLYRHDFKIVERFAVLLYHIRSSRGGRSKDIGQAIPWVIDGGKYGTLRTIQEGLPVNPKDNKRLQIQRIELDITPTSEGGAEKYQKLSIVPQVSRGQQVTQWQDCVEAVGDLFEDPEDMTSTCSLLMECIEPEPFQKLETSIRRMTESGGGGDDEFTETGRGQTRAPQGRARPAPAAGSEAEPDADEAGDFDAGGDDTFNDDPPAEEDAEVKPKPRTQTRKPTAATGGKKSPTRQAPAEDTPGDDDIPF